MLLYIRQLIQLILAPGNGWADISEAAKHPDEIQRSGFFPWVIVVALSNLLRLAYDSNLTLLTVIEIAIVVAGSLVASLFIGRLILDLTMLRFSDNVSVQKIHTFTMFVLGVNGLLSVISNAIPAHMTFTYILPVFSILVIFKANSYMGVRDDDSVAFVGVSTLTLVVIPILLREMLLLVI